MWTAQPRHVLLQLFEPRVFGNVICHISFSFGNAYHLLAKVYGDLS